MGWSKANLWDTPRAKAIADDIARISGVYCGPASVGWIAAVWNESKGKPYNYKARLTDKTLFPDGPRSFFEHPVGFQQSLNSILMRETDNELGLWDDHLYKYGTIHSNLEEHDLPIIIRMFENFSDGWHYTTLYKSNKEIRKWKLDRIKFFWQDNGLYGMRNGGNGGLYETGWRLVGQSLFLYGARRVVRM